MRLQRIHELVFHRPWLITPTGHEAIRSLLDRKMVRDSIEAAVMVDSMATAKQAGFFDDFIVGRPAASVHDGIGLVHVFGPIGIGLSKIEKTCGATDLNDLMAEIRGVVEQGAEKLMLITDSPGGTVGGVPEAADAIANFDIPTFAYVPAGALNCSAAYYLTCGADKVYASPSADVGSIGVYLPWIDQTAAYAERGYKVELITNKEGDLKGTGYPGTSLSEAQRADLQEGVQQIFDDFAAHVRSQRPDGIAADSLRGQSFSAKDAYKRRLTDGVTSYESALRTLKRFRRE